MSFFPAVPPIIGGKLKHHESEIIIIFDSAKIFEENFQKWIGAFRESSSIIIVILPGRSPISGREHTDYFYESEIII